VLSFEVSSRPKIQRFYLQSRSCKLILDLIVTEVNKQKRERPFLILSFVLWKLNMDFLFCRLHLSAKKISFCPCTEGFNPTSTGSPSRRLIWRRNQETRRVPSGEVAPNERLLAYFFSQIIRFFTLFRRHRCKTPDQYQHEHQSNCNIDELFHRFLLHPAFHLYFSGRPAMPHILWSWEKRMTYR